MRFSGKTVIVTGASRGIGLAIGKRLAADGASIAILAKTAEPHPKLPGTIYTAAEEIVQVEMTEADKAIVVGEGG